MSAKAPRSFSSDSAQPADSPALFAALLGDNTSAAATPGPVMLTATDRCDRCPAQAYVRVTLGMGTLLFCGHHFSLFEDPLRDQRGASVEDFRHLLNARSSASSF